MDGVFSVLFFLWWCFCGGVFVVVVFLWWCFCGDVFVAVFAEWTWCHAKIATFHGSLWWDKLRGGVIMNCFKGKMALKMAGWVGVYFPLHKGVIKQKMLLKLVHFWKAILQRLLADSAFSFFAAWPGHSGFVGIKIRFGGLQILCILGQRLLGGVVECRSQAQSCHGCYFSCVVWGKNKDFGVVLWGNCKCYVFVFGISKE